jgi:LysM repeat protein
MPQLPRVAVLFGALVIAALLVFLLPTLLNIGGRVESPPGASAGPSGAVASASAEPTPVPAPTPVIYTVKVGDTLTKIAKKYNVTAQQIQDANKDKIKDPNRIKVGDRYVIPTPAPAEIVGGSPSPSAS